MTRAFATVCAASALAATAVVGSPDIGLARQADDGRDTRAPAAAHRVVALPIADGIAIEMVEATNGFFIGRFEVTQGQWKALIGTSPSSFTGTDRPVEHVAWHAAYKFIEKANALEGVRRTGLRLRLPTAEEWELCCRAGGATNDFGLLASGAQATLDEIGWFADNSEKRTHDVGEKVPNAWGVFDMHGNVWELCDTFVFGGCVMKGGGWISPARSCRAGYRFPLFTYMTHDDVGFRLAADLVGQGDGNGKEDAP